MEMNPANLAVRFLLEMSALVAMGMWGWKLGDGWLQFILVIGIPLAAAIIWGTFNVLADPSRSGAAPVEVPGIVRIVIEIGFFATAAWMLYQIGYSKIGIIFVSVTIIHYIVSYERVLWLLKQ